MMKTQQQKEKQSNLKRIANMSMRKQKVFDYDVAYSNLIEANHPKP